jgi:glycine/D-amino acid oxidase-like deaminating enzyme
VCYCSDFGLNQDRGMRNSASKTRVAVVGAGAFGGWTALFLLRRGAQVMLVDAWGPGNSRASSGGETRIIRGTYGPDGIYTHMVARALTLWKENEARWNLKLYHRTGVLWMAGREDAYEKAALRHLSDAGLEFEKLTAAEAPKRFPQINFDGVPWVIIEKDAGYLIARRACKAVLNGFIAEGGEYRQLAVETPVLQGGELRSIKLSDGSVLEAEVFVFACGPWLGGIFPDVLGHLIRPTRQEVFFFGAPAGEGGFADGAMPVWIDHGEKLFYGIPGNQWRGFKLGDDTRGAEFDPTTGDRTPTAAGIETARRYMNFRFPGLAGAPMVEARVCQYEQSPDGNFILGRHPRAANIWLAGGGSGHGFKHGPALGEMMSELVLGGKEPDRFFDLRRFARSSGA